MRSFAAQRGTKLYDIGDGICHQVLPEGGHLTCGDLVVGTDTHSVTYGAFNALGTGIEGIMDIFREAPYLILPILGVLWMIFRLIDVVFGFSNDYDTYEVLMMGMMITVLLNTESLRNKK